MLQTLEREPQEELTNQIYDASPAPGRTPIVTVSLLCFCFIYCSSYISYYSLALYVVVVNPTISCAWRWS